jgi:hypothetical protein
MEEIGARRDKPMKPQVVAWELGKRLSSDAIVSADSRLDQALAAIAEVVFNPHSRPMTISVGMPRMVVVIGATVTL